MKMDLMDLHCFVVENGYNPAPATVVADQESKQTVNLNEKERESSTANGIEENANGKEISHQREENDLPESLEHNLPDSPFASPKVAANYLTAFNAAGEAEENAMVVSAATAANNHLITSSLISPTSPLDIAPFKSCYFQVPRFPSGHGAIGM